MAIEVILTTDVPKLGEAGNVVRVRPGYARNYLLPQGKALLATRARVSELDHKRRMIEEKVRKDVGAHEAVARRLGETQLEFTRKAGEEGKLFGSVTSGDIVERLAQQGVEVDRRKIVLEHSIKEIGDHAVEIRLHREVRAQIQVKVVAEE